MRSFLDPRAGRRRTQRSEKFRGRYGRAQATGQGGKKLIRFRRNRELMAREAVVTVLWLAIAVMLLMLTRSLWHVAQAHLGEHGPLAYYGLPALPLAASLGCLWRARSAWREFLDIRREQAALIESMQAELDGAPVEDES